MPNPAEQACLAGGPCPHLHDLAFSLGDLNPLKWLGEGAKVAIGDVWKAAMTALWSAGLWILGLAFKIIDAFLTPDLSAHGPLADVLPYTFALGGFIAVLMAFVQLGAAAFRRDGKSLARVLVGLVQFGAVWIGYIAIAALLVTATAGLTKGLLSGLLHVDAFSGFNNTAGWPRKIDDTVVATVLGLCTMFLIFPAAIGYVLLMLVREAALMILAATSPITAAGLLSEGTRAWFWKSMRWFLAALLMSPLAALVLGIGVQITRATVAGKGDKTAAAVGMAVVGSILILIGAVCPLILFKLLAFVDPGTPSGAQMRESLTAHGGVAGLLGGGKGAAGVKSATAGSGAATKQDGAGRAQGEAGAETATASRFASVMGGAGRVAAGGMNVLGKVATKSTNIGTDVLAGGGVGHQTPWYGNYEYGGAQRRGEPAGQAAPGGGPGGGDPTGTPGPEGTGKGGGGSPPTPPTPPRPPGPPTPHAPGAGSKGPLPGGGAGGGSGGAGEAGAGAAAEVPVVPV